MPCLVLILALFIPRVTLVLIWLFSNYLGRAYQTVLWPLLGFFFMPLTTLAYAWAMNANGSVAGGYLCRRGRGGADRFGRDRRGREASSPTKAQLNRTPNGDVDFVARASCPWSRVLASICGTPPIQTIAPAKSTRWSFACAIAISAFRRTATSTSLTGGPPVPRGWEASPAIETPVSIGRMRGIIPNAAPIRHYKQNSCLRWDRSAWSRPPWTLTDTRTRC